MLCGYIFIFACKGSRGLQGKQGFPGAQGREVRAHPFDTLIVQRDTQAHRIAN